MPRAAKVLAESLKLQGIERVFCVPGESYLSALDALYDIPEIDVVTSKQEEEAVLHLPYLLMMNTRHRHTMRGRGEESFFVSLATGRSLFTEVCS